jgi:Capsule polysaccharide biosynthesis protein
MKIDKLIRQSSKFWIDSKFGRRVRSAMGLKAGKKPSAAKNDSDGVSVNFPGLENLHLIGENWIDGSDPRPVAVLFKFDLLRREPAQRYLPEYRTAFVRKNTSWPRVKTALDKIEAPVFVVWGNGEDDTVKDYARGRGIPIHRMADGLLRDYQAPAAKSFPDSLVLDTRGCYFDATQPSDLEDILNTGDLADEALMARARRGMALIVKYGINRYNAEGEVPSSRVRPKKKRKVLVVGQAATDPAVLFGRSSAPSNEDLVKLAMLENPDSDIAFRYDPDPAPGTRAAKWAPGEIAKLCTVDTGPANEALLDCDHIYTVSSHFGFEGLMRSKTVSVFGAPFYAGWGLTDDRIDHPRRQRKISLEALFAGAFIVYPRYRLEGSAGTCAVEDVIARSVDARLNLTVGKRIDTSVLMDSESYGFLSPHLSARSRLIQNCHLAMPQGRAACDAIAADYSELFVKEFSLIATIMRDNYNFDALETFIGRATSDFNGQVAAGTISQTEIIDFLTNILFAYRWLNGRVAKVIPSISDEKLQSMDAATLRKIYPAYFRVLVSALQYDEAHSSVAALGNKLDPIMLKLATYSREKPYRVERDGRDRFFLRNFIADRFLEQAMRQSRSGQQSIMNRLRYELLCDNYDGAIALLPSLKPVLAPSAAVKKVFDLMALNKVTAKINVALLTSASALKELVGYLGNLFNDLLKIDRIADAKKVLAHITPHLDKKTLTQHNLKLLMATRKYEQVKAAFEKMPDDLKMTAAVRMSYAKALRFTGGLAEADATLTDYYKAAKLNIHKDRGVFDELAKVQFVHRASQIVSYAPQPRLPKGVVFLCSMGCLNTVALLTPALHLLKKRGFAVVHLSPGMLVTQRTGLDFVDQFANTIPIDMGRMPLANEWHIDWEARIVASGGVNFYQGIFERLSTIFRKFTIDLNDPVIGENFFSYLSRADQCLTVLKKIDAEMNKRGMPSVLITGNYHVAPYSIFRDYCLALPERNLVHFAAVNVAYESYYSNLGSKYSSSVAVCDMSFHKNIRAPFLAVPSRFETWFAANEGSKLISDVTKAQLGTKRIGGGQESGRERTERFIADARAEGKKVICCFGKLLCDLGVPFDGGPAHRDMVDWINHTVSTIGGRTDAVLIIKPHPHELRPEIVLDLAEYLRDVLPKTLPGNVLFLGHSEFGIKDIAPLIDLAIVWNGTSALELTILGIPTIACSYFGKHDYPVDLMYPESREQYEGHIVSGSYKKPSKAMRARTAALLAYLGTDDVSLPNRYSRRPITNDSVGVPTWDEALVNEFVKNGDPYMDVVAARIVEGISQPG